MDCSWDTETYLAQVHPLPPELQNILVHGSSAAYLDALSNAALDSRYTDNIIIYFKPLLPDICARWKPEKLHAMIAAFARVLPFAPHLAELAEQKLKNSDHYPDLLRGTFDPDRSPETSAGEILVGIYRLLLFDNASFAKLIRPARLSGLLCHQDRSIRYLAIRILCLYVPASDTTMNAMISNYIGDSRIYGEWDNRRIDFLFFSLWEKKRLDDLSSRFKTLQQLRLNRNSKEVPVRVIEDNLLSTEVCNLSGTLLIRSAGPPSPPRIDFVSTPSTVENVKAMSTALTQAEPILITGLPGSGKTITVQHVAEKLNKISGMVTIHLNKQSDMKMLIGIYTTGMTPGSFEWQPGVLTKAVEEGRWLFIEDLDRAPNEILATILPLIERRELLIPSRGIIIKAPQSFRIIATMRSHIDLRGEDSIAHCNIIGIRLWKRISFAWLGPDGMSKIIDVRFPKLKRITPQIMRMYIALQPEKFQSKGFHSNGYRPVTPRDLFKWCHRIHDLLGVVDSRLPGDIIPERLMDDFLLEAVDCFARNIPEESSRMRVSLLIAEHLHLDSQRLEYLVRDRHVAYHHTKEGSIQFLRIGRIKLPRIFRPRGRPESKRMKNEVPFATDPHTSRLLEQLTAGILRKEPILLVGETGLGKTTAVQHLADCLGHKLVVVNLSQQSETGDLLGGYKPIDVRSMVIPLKDEFDALFEMTFSHGKNRSFKQALGKCVAKSQWKRVVTLWNEALKLVEDTYRPNASSNFVLPLQNSRPPPKKRRVDYSLSVEDLTRWKNFAIEVKHLENRLSGPQGTFNFSYVEGKLIRAVRNGDWVLLDEINLATSDTLECISDLLENGANSQGSILLTETGKLDQIKAHADFQMFGAMNPAMDVGKRDLPMAFRSRFTEIYVESPDKDFKSLTAIVETCLSTGYPKKVDSKIISEVVSLYQDIQYLASQGAIVDGSGQRPHYSLRSLTRAVGHANKVSPRCTLRRGLLEGFSMCFLTCLDNPSEVILMQAIRTRLFSDFASADSEITRSLKIPDADRPYVEIILQEDSIQRGKRCVHNFRHWVPRGQFPVEEITQYVITPYIRRNLENLIRAVSTERLPVLIQGPTSAGKTSMVEYLAKISGNNFVRINNHEHTDLQEYIGTYISTTDGQLVFQEGVLVQALRCGYWVVLDELNLAPSDVLEALNRLLDDNRELLIPETQEIVQPHSDFRLFATQNPAGPYGGRKVLSRAFRNRFLELHFDDIPINELKIILCKRSQIPESWCGLVVEVYQRLSQLRQQERLFEQNSFATLRDLFRWTLRTADSLQQLAINGYMLLAEKVRTAKDKNLVRAVIENVMSRKGNKIFIDDEKIYVDERFSESHGLISGPNDDIIWTKAMRRLYILVHCAIMNNEPVLLVGETGTGKTTVCQVLAKSMGKPLHIVNAQQNTEAGDLIGAQRPVRNQGRTEQNLVKSLHEAFMSLEMSHNATTPCLEHYLPKYDSLDLEQKQKIPLEIRTRIKAGRNRLKTLFEWYDGSLVRAMRAGEFYLLDEISLAEDSVLERMNSVLDPQRTILLAEKGSTDASVVAKHGFQFLATMNPGGDFGKKELSPALRNRFTEIWVPAVSDYEDILAIVHAKLRIGAKHFAAPIVQFAQWFSTHYGNYHLNSVSIRDLLTWIDFINKSILEIHNTIVHGAAMVFFDALGANPSALMIPMPKDIHHERITCLRKLNELFDIEALHIYSLPNKVSHGPAHLTIGAFSIPIRHRMTQNDGFNFCAPTPLLNAMRILRALQLSKSILLEGEPGVGKTSIISAIADAVGIVLTRINLSEQTDLMDLFGSDVPSQNAGAGQFSWRDGPFLSALKSGGWVLLDEMNLASQSVLEGLNACLDHRGEVYIPELDQTFHKHQDFRLFAAQNPHLQGGGRKGLPISFVNRFSVVYIDRLKSIDLSAICKQVFPATEEKTLARLISFVADLENEILGRNTGPSVGTLEFNLRDILRCLQLMNNQQHLLPAIDLNTLSRLLLVQRFRSLHHQKLVRELFASYFPEILLDSEQVYANTSATTVQFGYSVIQRSEVPAGLPRSGFIISSEVCLIQDLMICVQCSWPVILVGSSGAGKSRALNTLASLLGVTMVVFAMNSDIDTTDLIGGYEQVDVSRHVQKFLGEVKTFLRTLYSISASEKNISTTRVSLEELMRGFNLITTEAANDVMLGEIRDLLHPLAHNSDHGTYLLHRCEELLRSIDTGKMGRFEWVDGVLVQAVKQGKWLVLDNANLCASSVLDRLNSLLEPNGSLIISENCHEDGSCRVIKRHPDFRIFLTMDPQHGELSRAMRNRGVEIFIPAAQKSHQLEFRWNILSMPTLESSMLRFHQLIELDTLVPDENSLEKLVNYCCDNLSLSDQTLLERFCQQAAHGLTSKFLAKHLARRCQFGTILSQEAYGSWCKNIEDYYRTMQDCLGIKGDYHAAQPLYPLANRPLVACQKLSSAISYDAAWLAATYDVLLDTAKGYNALETIWIVDSTKSLVHNSKSTIKDVASAQASKDPTFRVAAFLVKSQTAFADWVSNFLRSGRHHPPTLLSFGAFRAYWWTLISFLVSEKFDHASLQVIQELGKQAISRVYAEDHISAGLMDRICQYLDDIFRWSNIQSGKSMEQLWGVFRPHVPSNVNRFEALRHLEQLADRFDSLLCHTSASLAELSGLSSRICTAIGICRTADLDTTELSRDIECLLKRLSSIVENTGPGIRPYFEAEFEGLCQMLDLDRISNRAHKGSKKYPVLNLLASRATKSVFFDESQSSGARLLSDFVKSSGGVSRIQIPFAVGNQMHASLLQKVANLGQIPLRQLGLLKQEFTELCKAVSRQSRNIASVQYHALEHFLRLMLRIIMESHSDLVDFQSLDHSGNFKFYPSVPPDHYFRKIADEYFQLSALQTQPQIRSESIADCLVKFAIGLLLLYVPSRIVDPMQKPIIRRWFHDKHKSDLIQERLVLETIEQTQMGTNVVERLKLVEKDLAIIGDGPPVPAIARPESSELNNLQVEFLGVLRIVEAVSKQEKSKSLLIVPEVIENISQSILRLEHDHRVYEDMTAPVVAFLTCLKVGLIIKAQFGAEQNQRINDFDALLRQTPFMDAQADLWNFSRTNIHALDLHSLRIASLLHTIDDPARWRDSVKNAIMEIFEGFFLKWKSNLCSDQKRSAASSSLYHYRGNESDEDVNDQAGLIELFPNSEEVSALDQSENSQDNRSYEVESSEIVSLHEVIFTGRSLEPAPVQHIMKSAFRMISGSDIGNFNNRDPKGIAKVFPVLLLELRRNKLELYSSRQPQIQYNIYTDSNVFEISKFIKLVKCIQRRFWQIRAAWPENSTVLNVIETCNEVLALQINEPVIKIFPVAEKLHAFLAEWQSVASTEFSIIEHQKSLTDMLIGWRRLELASWSLLLDNETQRCYEKAKTWWYIAYENLVALPLAIEGDETSASFQVDSLVSTMDTFLLSSTLGEYSVKLRLLNTLLGQLSTLVTERKWAQSIVAALSNLVTFRSKFEPFVASEISSHREKIEQEVKDVIKLASWKDRNIDALKQSAKTNRFRLLKLVKKYRNLLNAPIEYIMNRELPDLAGKPQQMEMNGPSERRENTSTEISSWVSMLNICRESQIQWSIRPERFKNISSTVSMMRSKVEATNSNVNRKHQLHTFLEDLMASIQNLRDSTPAIKTEDNTSLVKYLRTRKRKLFSDTLKQIRQMGLTSNPGTIICSQQNTFEKVLSSMPFLSLKNECIRVDCCRNHLHKTLVLMPEVRRASLEHSNDLNSVEISRCIGYLESILALTIKQQQCLLHCVEHLDRLRVKVKEAEASWQPRRSDTFVASPSETVQFQLVERALAWLPTIINVGIDLLEAQDELGEIDFSALINYLRRVEEQLRNARARYQNHEKLLDGFTSTSQKTITHEAIDLMKDFANQLVNLMDSMPNAQVLIQHIMPWTILQSYETPDSTHNRPIVTLSQFNFQLYKILDLMLIGIQDVEPLVQYRAREHEDSSWLLEEDKFHFSAIKALNLPHISQMFCDFLEKMQSLSKPDFAVALASAASTMPVIQQYQAICTRMVKDYASFHCTVAETSFRLSKTFSLTAANGFCSPAEKSNDAQDTSKKVEGGTGLGNGDAAEDISQDVGKDEDLSELAQEKNDSSREQETEKHEDAIEIDSQLRGGIDDNAETASNHESASPENGSEKEAFDEDGGNGSEEDTGGDLDEAMGNVDRNDTSAVDEKLWDNAVDNLDTKEDSGKSVGTKDQQRVAATTEQKARETGESLGREDDTENLDDEDVEGSISSGTSEAKTPERLEFEPSYVSEIEGLDLPDELQLDGDKDKQSPGVDNLEDDAGASETDIANDGFTENEMDRDNDSNEEINDPEELPENQKSQTHLAEEPPHETNEKNTDDEHKFPKAPNMLGEDQESGKGSGEGETNTLFQNEEKPKGGAENNADEEPPIENISPSANGVKREIGPNLPSPDSRQDRGDNTIGRLDDESEISPEEKLLRQLGSTLEKWHRLQRKIYDASKDFGGTESHSELLDSTATDFEHLPQEQSRMETQALGASTKDQAQALDDRMAIDHEDAQLDVDMPDAEGTPDQDDVDSQDVSPKIVDIDQNVDETSEKMSSQAFSGTSYHIDSRAFSEADMQLVENDPQSLNDLEESLDVVHLQTDSSMPGRTIENAFSTWQNYEARTVSLAYTLTGLLRLILEPTLSTKFRGDFRTGKRLNIKRIIPYIASSYKRDKIWMRRAVPSKRAYQILLAIDDSKSMAENGSKDLAFECLAVVAKSLTMLEVGELGVLGFGQYVQIAHELSSPWTATAGANCIQQFTFQQQRTNVKLLVQESINLLRNARLKANVGPSGSDLWQLQLIVSDGICEDHEAIRRLLLAAQEAQIMIIFVIVDAVEENGSILDLEKVEFVQEEVAEEDEGTKMRLQRKKYLESFPFRYYLIVKNVRDLPGVLATALRQWFAEVAER